MLKAKQLRVCYILSYYFPGYVRTQTLLNALRKLPFVTLYEAVNRKTSFLHYLETILKLIVIRLKYNPDLYILGFRGYELYWVIRLLTWKRPLIYDHMMSPYDSLIFEKKTVKQTSFFARIIYKYEQSILQNADLVLTDTPLHQHYFSSCFQLSQNQVHVVHVSTDEELFKPMQIEMSEPFTIFFYGSFLPLHGIDIILEAARLIHDLPIRFHLVGGHKLDLSWFHEAVQQKQLSNIDHTLWIPYTDLPQAIAKANLCLGGPLGNTGQAQRVITGKTYQFLAMGKPTIIGQIDYNYPFIDKENCFYIPQGNANGLAEAIRWAYLHAAQLPEIGQNGYHLYQEMFSINHIATELESILLDKS